MLAQTLNSQDIMKYSHPISNQATQPVGQNYMDEEMKKANVLIRFGWITAILIVGFAALSEFNDASYIDGYDCFAYLMYSGLAYGIYRKSRTCSIILFLVFIFCTIYYATYSPGLGLYGILLCGLSFPSVIGTFKHHRINSDVIVDPDRAETDIMENNETISHAMELKKAVKRIKIGWISGLISGSLTLLFTLLATEGMYYLEGHEDMNILYLLDVFLIFGLSFGMWRKSRACATIMFIYFVISKIWFYAENGIGSESVFGIFYCYLYFLAVLGTFSYHKLAKKIDIEKTMIFLKGYKKGLDKAWSDAMSSKIVVNHEVL